MERECHLRFCERQLSRCCQIDSYGNPRSPWHGRRHRSQGGLLHSPIRRRFVALQFRRNKSGGPAETLNSGGQNLLRGLENLLVDLERGNGRLSITMTDMKAFRLGENIATTLGKIVYQTDLMQLIQYGPSTQEVRRRPLLIVPPWINKFYVLDLQPKNSFIKWAVDQGHTVFVISWVNPDEKLAEKTFENYMIEGPLAALDVIESATGERSVNTIGYCLGGTLLASTAAYLAAKG